MNILNLSSSLEDYLEAILELDETETGVRLTDISQKLHVEKPSAYTAVKKLKNLALVHHEKYGNIFLTEKGRHQANLVIQRHKTLKHFLKDFLFLDEDTAEKDACQMEHAMSCRSFERLSRFIDYLDKTPEINLTKIRESLCKN